MPIQGMNHFTVLAADLDATKHFYIDVLGLRQGDRPDLGFPGVWLYVGNEAVLRSSPAGRCPRTLAASSITWPSRRAGSRT